MVVAYNQCKTYIDLSDQMTSYAPYLRRTVKCYRRVALEMLLGSCAVNALVLYNKMNTKMGITDFKDAIPMGLLFPPDEERPPRAPTDHRLDRVPGPVTRVRRSCVRCYEQQRQLHDRKYCQKHAHKVPTKCQSSNKFLQCHPLIWH
uniref:PiggyBac transposable element-derived protein domain-containing protein n=1 Tax=Cacopsylla melanoneura TaxID=428564 RepID=A0A8D9BFI6_9HEMI